MPVPAPGSRHARLFEYLRQQNFGDITSRRLAEAAHSHRAGMDARMCLVLANRSWRRPPVDPPKKPALAAKPARDHEFFRAIRA